MKKGVCFQLSTLLLFSASLTSCGGSGATDTSNLLEITPAAGEGDNYGYIVNLPAIKATSSESFSINWTVTEDNNNCEADVLMMSKSYAPEDSPTNITVLNAAEVGEYSINCYPIKENTSHSDYSYKCEGTLASPTKGNTVKNYGISLDKNATYFLRLANQSQSNGIDYGDIFYTLSHSAMGEATITKYTGQ